MADPTPQSSNPITQAATLAKSPLGSPDDVHRLVGALDRIMDALDDVLIEETDLLKEGKLHEALELVEAKNQLSIQYMLLQKAITANADLVKHLAPEDSEHLTRRHYLFQNTLQANLAVIATAKAVTGELVENINTEVQKGAKASTYGNTGYAPNTVVQNRGIAVDTAT